MPANSTDLERMIVAIDAQTERLRSELKRGERGVASFEKSSMRRLDRIDRRFNQLGSGLAKLKGRLTSATAGLAAGLGFGALINGAKQTLTEFDALAKQADTVGLSTDFFQTLQLATEEASVSQQLLNSSLIAFAKRVGEARAGTGSLITVFKKLRPDLLEQLQTVRSQEQAFKLLADAVKNTDSAQERAALAAAAFSRAGVQLVRVLQLGSNGLEETRRKALELGIIIDESLLRNTEKLANQFGVASLEMDRQFKQTLIELAPIIVSTAQGIAQLARGVRLLVAEFKSVDQLGRFELDQRAAALRREIKRLEDASDPKKQNLLQRLSVRLIPDNFTKGLREAREQLAEIERLQFKASQRVIPNTPQAVTRPRVSTSRSGSRGTNAAQSLVRERQQAERSLNALNRQMLAETGKTRQLLAASHEEELGEFRRLLDNKLITHSEFEAARRNLATISARRIGEIQLSEMRVATEAVESFASGAEDAFSNWIETGKLGTKELVRSMLADFARLSFGQAINPLRSGLTSLLGSFFGGFRADGGPVDPSKAFVVGERGPELFVPKVAGNIVPALSTRGVAGDGGMTVNITNVVKADGAVEGTVAQIAQALEANNKQLERDLPGMMANARRRFE